MIFNNRIFYKTVNSTNDLLSELIGENKVTENIVLISDFQTKGKGQINKKWHSEIGKNLLFSIYLKPKNYLVSNKIYFTIVTSLAIIYTLKKYIKHEELQIKWPNDILVNQEKISGILIETKVLKKKIKTVIIGCGININQRKFSFKENNPTSINLILKKEIDKSLFLDLVLKELDLLLDLLRNQKYSFLKKEYLSFLNNPKLFSKN